MTRLFLFAAISLAITLTVTAIASTVDPRAFEDAESLTQEQRDSLEDLLVNRQPAILHEPIYADENEEEALAVTDSISDRITERGEEPLLRD